MPKFFFDTDAGDRSRRDREGVVLPGLSAAKDEAAGLLRDLSHGASIDGAKTYSCEVRQDGGDAVYRVTMMVEGRAI